MGGVLNIALWNASPKTSAAEKPPGGGGEAWTPWLSISKKFEGRVE
jgi:hypothetical protein